MKIDVRDFDEVDIVWHPEVAEAAAPTPGVLRVFIGRMAPPSAACADGDIWIKDHVERIRG